MTTMPTGGAGSDPALEAVRAMLSAMPGCLAVFDADGVCLTANRGYMLRAAEQGDQSQTRSDCRETRTAFSPDGVRHWTIVTIPDEPATRPPATFNEMIANALPLMCSAQDTELRYLFMNRFQAEIYGVRQSDAIGRTTRELLGPTFSGDTRDIDLEVIRTGRVIPFFEESFAAADGEMHRWLSSKVPLIHENGAVWAIATVSLDITERNRLEEGLRQAKVQAELANRVKSGFLAAMSHELRTPLNAVIGFGEIIHQEALGPIGAAEYRDYAGHILRSGQHLLSLINDILDFARIESGSLRLNISPVDLGVMVRATLDVLTKTAETAGVVLSTDITQRPIVIHADEQRLRQVLLNVAGNAVKFTPAGGSVTVTLAPDTDGGAVITVTDSGIGIAESDVASVFDAFWQADSGLDRVKAGAGIGLPLAQQLIALHGGRLDLRSRLGEGTQVILKLPTGNAAASTGTSA
jgi:PAS domain S-box-containing protein